MSPEQVWETAGTGGESGHGVSYFGGSLHPELSLDWFCQMLARAHDRFPQVHLEGVHDGSKSAIWQLTYENSIRETL
jgi:2-iminoacetate synthase ThiH